MIEAVQVFWSPVGANMPSLGARALVDVTDGDTPNIRMPVRMLSVDTPEVTARTQVRAAAIDGCASAGPVQDGHRKLGGLSRQIDTYRDHSRTVVRQSHCGGARCG